MCMYSAKDGVPGDFHLVHYGSRAIGGAGLDLHRNDLRRPDARITPGCTGRPAGLSMTSINPSRWSTRARISSADNSGHVSLGTSIVWL